MDFLNLLLGRRNETSSFKCSYLSRSLSTVFEIWVRSMVYPVFVTILLITFSALALSYIDSIRNYLLNSENK